MAEVYTDRDNRRPINTTARTYDRTPTTTTHRGLSSTAKVGIGLLLIALAVIFLLMVIF